MADAIVLEAILRKGVQVRALPGARQVSRLGSTQVEANIPWLRWKNY